MIRPVEILLVEDDPIDARLTFEAFKETNGQFNLRLVKDGVEAIAYLRQEGKYAAAHRPDMIFLDLNLPKKNGIDVLTEVKQNPHFKRIPVLVLTISDSENDIVGTYDLHANCFITKPLDLEKFIKVLKSIKEFWFNTAKLPLI